MSLELKTGYMSDSPTFLPTSPRHFESLSIDDLENRIGQTALHILRLINKDTRMRLTGCFEDPTLLNQGLFSANEYYATLQTLQQKLDPESLAAISVKDRIESLVNHGAFYHGFCNKNFFTYIPTEKSATGKVMNVFRIQPNVLPSEAIESLLGESKQFMLIDSAGIYQIVYTATLLHVLGKEKFDTLFAENDAAPLTLGIYTSYMQALLTTNKQNMKPGDLVFFKYPPSYMDKHWNGEGRSLNWLFDEAQGNKRFVGFGYPDEGVSDQTVLQECVAEYNETPLHTSAMNLSHRVKLLKLHGAAARQLYKELKTDQISVESLLEYHKESGSSYNTISCLNALRIQQLIKVTPDEALAIMKKWVLIILRTTSPKVSKRTIAKT